MNHTRHLFCIYGRADEIALQTHRRIAEQQSELLRALYALSSRYAGIDKVDMGVDTFSSIVALIERGSAC